MTQIIYRIILLWAVGGPLMAVYLMINHRENLAHDPVTMPEWVPFWPLLAIPYLGMLIVPGCLSLFINEQGDFYQYLVSITIAFLVCISGLCIAACCCCDSGLLFPIAVLGVVLGVAHTGSRVATPKAPRGGGLGPGRCPPCSARRAATERPPGCRPECPEAWA